tara:strand:+ start:250 stop:450 length:201 start_codon:yes stop_codon:yes gene_type:complete
MNIFVFLVIALFSKNCFAYLDPGLGSLFIQAILGGLAAIITTATIYWYKLKKFFQKILNIFFSKKK